MINLIHINIFNTDLTPDFILLTLIFWFFKSPNAVSISTFWLVGLITDIFIGDLLGQHALTYASCYFIAQYFISKIMLNNKHQKLLYIFLIFLMLDLQVVHLLQEKKGHLNELLIVTILMIPFQHIMLEDIRY